MKKWTFSLVLCGLTWILLSFSTQALAYVFTDDFQQGFYWAHVPLTFRVANDASDSGVTQKLTQEAMDEWEQDVGQQIWQMDDKSSNVIRWSNNFAADTGYDAQTTLAVTVRYHAGTYIGRVEIVINQGQEVLRRNAGGYLRQTILHELGHTLGLGHSDTQAVMQAYLQFYSGLQSDDIDGMNEVLRQTRERQANHYVSPMASNGTSSSSGKFLGCGGGDSSNALKTTQGFTLSLFTGLLCSVFLGFLIKLPRVLKAKRQS
ncbi:MAG: matrixin family metalloprotease [Pseudomonadota bacterium]